MSALLEKVKMMGAGLSRGFRGKLDFNSNARALSAALAAGVHIIGKDGEVLGNAGDGELACPVMAMAMKGHRYFPTELNEFFLNLTQTKVLNKKDSTRCLMQKDKVCAAAPGSRAIVPVYAETDLRRERAGTLLLYRPRSPFTDDDMVIVELFLAITTIELTHGHYDTLQEKERKEASIRSVVESLSYAELQVVKRVLQEVRNESGFIVAAKIAAELQYAASVVASALRKLEGAAAIETRSRGIKGTYIHILNDRLSDEVAKVTVG